MDCYDVFLRIMSATPSSGSVVLILSDVCMTKHFNYNSTERLINQAVCCESNNTLLHYFNYNKTKLICVWVDLGETVQIHSHTYKCRPKCLQ